MRTLAALIIAAALLGCVEEENHLATGEPCTLDTECGPSATCTDAWWDQVEQPEDLACRPKTEVPQVKCDIDGVGGCSGAPEGWQCNSGAGPYQDPEGGPEYHLCWYPGIDGAECWAEDGPLGCNEGLTCRPYDTDKDGTTDYSLCRKVARSQP